MFLGRKFLLLFSLAWMASQGLAQQEVFSEHLSTINGLNTNTIYHITQDKNRFLWFSTDVGVSRYDGSELINYGYSDGLPDHDIFAIEESKDGTLWFLSFDGQLTSYRNGIFTTEKALSCTKGYLSGFLEDGSTRVVSSYGGGIRVFRDGKLHHIYDTKDASANFISAIWQNTNAYYAISPMGIHKIDKKTLRSTLIQKHPGILHTARFAQLANGDVLYTGADFIAVFTQMEKIKMLRISGVLGGSRYNAIQYRDGKVFVATDNGLHIGKILGDSLALTTTTLSGERVTWTYADHEQNMWISTLNNGVFRVSNLDIRQLDPDPVFSLSKEANTLMIGFSGGMYATIGSNGDFVKEGLNSKDVIRGFYDWGDIKIFLYPGSAGYVSGSVFRKMNVGIAAMLRNGSEILVGNQNGLSVIPAGVFYSNVCLNGQRAEEAATTLYSGYKVKDIVRKGKEIFVLTNKGVFRYEKGKEALSDDEFRVLRGKNVSDMQVMDGRIAVSTIGHGIFVFDGKGYRQLTTKDGIVSNHVLNLSLSEGKQPMLIAGSHLGLSVIDHGKSGFRVRNLTTNDGLPASDIIDVEYFNGHVYLGTSSGCFRLNMDNIFAETVKPRLQIRRMRLNDKSVVQLPVSLAYWQNKITVDLGTVAFRQQSDVKYMYQINGSGKWEEAQNGILSLISLMPGEYNVDVKVCIGGVCSDVKRISFTIAPPFWQTTWFRLTMILLFIGIVYLFFRIRVLTYNRDVVRELLQVFLSRLKREETILVKDTRDGSLTKIPAMNIRYIKGADNYIELHLNGGDTILVRDTMTNILEQKLTQLKTPFVRCHRSYIVNGKRVDGVHNDFLKIGDERIPIGKKYFQTIEQKKKVLSMH